MQHLITTGTACARNAAARARGAGEGIAEWLNLAAWPIFLALLVALGAITWIGSRCNIDAALGQCRAVLVQDIYDFQTLITGFVALLAAFITLRPARKQLQKMNIQSSVMAREVIAERIREAETRKAALKAKLEEITQWFYRDLFPGDPEAEPRLSEEWAFNAEQTVDVIIRYLQGDARNHNDTAPLKRQHDLVIAAAKSLGACLCEIHTPASTDLDDPEYDLSEERIAEIQDASVAARGRLVDLIGAVQRNAEALSAALETRLVTLREVIRRIDDLIVDAEITSG